MRLSSSLAALLPCAVTVVACGFNPGGGPGAGDDDANTIDAAVVIDGCIPATETCDGTDQDCDGRIDEGFLVGAPCDGPDADQCTDDVTICNSQGAVVCGDTSGDDDVELCNAVDDDCDGMVDEGFMVGALCDGPDTDVCLEGTFGCAPDGLSAICSDMTSSTVEVCNGLDDDCDMVIDDGFDLQTDEANCGECGNTCTNSLGTTMCLGGHCMPSCSAGSADCDGEPDNGCELQDTNPQCNPLGTSTLGVNGDAASTAMTTGTTEAFIRVRVRESVGMTNIPLTARFALVSGAGTNFDLVVSCFACGGLAITDADDVIEIGRDDAQGDRGFDVLVEVRYGTPASTTCAPWTLTITGNVATNNRCIEVGGMP